MLVSLIKLSWEIPKLFKLNLINLIDSWTDNFVSSFDILSKLSKSKLGFCSIIFFAILILFLISGIGSLPVSAALPAKIEIITFVWFQEGRIYCLMCNQLTSERTQ